MSMANDAITMTKTRQLVLLVADSEAAAKSAAVGAADDAQDGSAEVS